MGFAITRKDGFYGWVTLSSVAVVFFLVNGGVLYSFAAFLPSICREFGWSRGNVSSALTLSHMVGTVVAMLAGFLIARYGARKAVVAGSFLIVLGMLLLSILTKQWEFFLGYGILGIGMGFAGHIASSTVASNWFVKKAPLAMSVVVTSAGIGGLVIVPLVMAVINRMGWRSAYQLLAAAFLLFGVVIAWILVRNKPEDLGQVPDGPGVSEPKHDKARSTAPTYYVTSVHFTLREAMGTWAFWMVIVLGLAALFIVNLVTSHEIAFLTGIGISSQKAALATGLIPGLGVVGTLLTGFLAIRFGVKRLAVAAACLMVLGVILVLMTKSVLMAFAHATVFGVGFGATMVSTASIVPAYFGRTNFSKIAGISGLFRIIGGFGAPLGGYLFDATRSYFIPHVICLIVAVIGVGAVVVLKPPLHPSLRGLRQ